MTMMRMDRARVGVLAGLAWLTFAGASFADEAKGPTVLKGARVGNLGWLAFSADGSRLASACCVAQGEGALTENVNRVIVWDVAKQQQICATEHTKAGSVTGSIMRVWISPDGKTVVTLEYNADAIARNFRDINGFFNVWDGATGKWKGAMALTEGASTAAAMSPDGDLFAVGRNEQADKARTIYRVGEITVWDLKTQKVKQTLLGTTTKGRPTTFGVSGQPGENGVEALAFSPDGAQLAAAYAGAEGGAGGQLKLWDLKTAKDTATLKGAEPRSGELEWLSDGKTVVSHLGASLAQWDTTKGEREAFSLTVPGAAGKRPAPGTDSTKGAATEFHVNQSFLSADGARLAAMASRANLKADPPLKEYEVVFWDVAARRPWKTLPLPATEFTSFEADEARNRPEMAHLFLHPGPVALSPDGKLVAVGDLEGVVRVYDATQIEAGVNTKTEDAKPEAAKPEPAAPAADDPLPVGSMWKGEKHRNEGNKTMPATLKITERDGASFKGQFTFGEGNVNEVAGTVADGKIDWDTTKVVKGNLNQPMSGTLKGDTIDAKFDLTTGGGKYRATGTVKMTKSD